MEINPLRSSHFRQLRDEFLRATIDSLREAGAHRDEAEALLSSMFCSVWNDAEKAVQTFPRLGKRQAKS